jgi:hypothetical protein
LTFDDPLTLMAGRNPAMAKIGSKRGDHFFLDLQEERIPGAIGLHVDAVVAEADRAGPYHLEGNVDWSVLGQKVAAFRLQAVGVCGKRVQNALRRFTGNPLQNGFIGLEDARLARRSLE